ncbi:hypothetical protein F5882DRAFT_458574 [Hyaloscypha sp. PMI_1271]|nr:hypothetical protein F5882DRAFT_458574 [Hyaloscypha sp. PMI_1271]
MVHRHLKRARGEYGETDSTSSSEASDTEVPENGRPHAPLGDIGIKELLEHDSRPTFILDLHALGQPLNGRMPVVFVNRSLRFFDDLRNVIEAETFYPPTSRPPTKQQEAAAAADADFKAWSTSVPNFDGSTDGYLPRHAFRGMYWTSSTLRGRWRVVSGSQVPKQRNPSHGTTPRSSRSTSRSIETSTGASASTEMTDSDLLPEELTLNQKLADSESKFRVLTELNPVGMYYLNPKGDILYCNDMWYEITGHPRGLEGEMSFMNVISELDHPIITEEWIRLTTQRGRRSFALRLRNPWIDEATGTPRQKWILCSCDQEFDEEGRIKTIMGCITDISAQKFAEESAVARANLVEKLALRTQEAAQHERNFQQMAELAPCGMFTFDPEGTITWANPQWYEMTGHSRSQHCPMSILNCIEQQDHFNFHEQWKRLTVAKEEVTSELRLKKPWASQESNESVRRDTTWILFLAIPQLDDEGNLTKVLGCTTDISHFKWAESVQLQSRLQAEEAKRQQETFIDMTSHEMRNPLSAIMLCADGIANSLVEFQSFKTADQKVMSQSLVESNLDAAQTIVLCAQHQKRIIDDVLTLSKLNSAMLHVTPIQIQVESTVRRTLKMFEGELLADDIQMTFVLEESYKKAQIDWVFCDPVRLTQIFINLLTNAIKFTRSESKREIMVSLGASLSKPPKESAPHIQWFPSKDSNSHNDLTLAPDWGFGPQVYLYFAVKDTGRGLDEEEKTKLFHRFSQASPRTHVQYGGSGLGLFISRELTELQGGEIGVESTAGAGSTFAFFIKGRKVIGEHSSNPSTPGSRMGHGSTINVTVDTMTLTPPKTRRNYHILLVEDNLINQKVLSKQLRNAGCVVHVANHGGEALDFLSTTTLWNDSSSSGPRMELSIILMDLEMPIMDGLACTRRIRDLEREGKIVGPVPIIAVTANTRMEQMEQALESGMDDIVAKPFQIPELMQKTDQLVRKPTP